ncbi:hypothetical protein WR25_04662 isoform A [Diploscapter pachys]|uniref:beta-N-acetylhexosaminidase n=1 Tax=Diploscapter pachys TaxID=2018661 RepID=A0A2A2KHL9_9BILA|nr:hypothetical protein WR25_04662 isoform A [Diploscapter pachys]
MLRNINRYLPRSKWTKLLYLTCGFTSLLLLSTIFRTNSIEHSPFMQIADNPNEDSINDVDHDRADPDRVDAPDRLDLINQNPIEMKRKSKPTAQIYIGHEKYPKLNSMQRFIPQRRIVHLDLKGGAPKIHYFTQLFSFFNRIKATGILIEWEDMFPFTGKLSQAVNTNAYSMKDVETILSEAKKRNLQIIPLIQTFGHLEWVLKLKEFKHLRDSIRFPQVICFAEPEGWDLIRDMIVQVAEVHKKYGMDFFHMGADEVFQIGNCNASSALLASEGSKDRLMLWHMARTAKFIKQTYNTTVLAWHDMFAHVLESDLLHYNLTTLLQPVLWSYAEDLDLYLPRSTWASLQPFGHVWGSSAWKGADGPAKFNSNPFHYIRNHESWTNQFTAIYEDFEVVEGLILAGWSRYDHLAVLCELLPIALPTLSMSMETILEGRPLVGSYPITNELLQCEIPMELGFAIGCKFPGKKIYELINEMHAKKKQLKQYRDEDFELNGWLGRIADGYSVSSQWYIEKITPMIEIYGRPLLRLESELRFELSQIFYQVGQNDFSILIFIYYKNDLGYC